MLPVIAAPHNRAGGIRDDGSLPPWVHRRLDTAAALYQQQQGTTCSVLCSGGGTPHRRTVLSPTGFIIFESTACAEYLMAHNVRMGMVHVRSKHLQPNTGRPKQRHPQGNSINGHCWQWLLFSHGTRHTGTMEVCNGYHSMHRSPNHYCHRNIAVVTSAFHMPRSRAIMQTCCRLVAQDVWQDPAWYGSMGVEGM